jgi:hypothetical protein
MVGESYYTLCAVVLILICASRNAETTPYCVRLNPCRILDQLT